MAAPVRAGGAVVFHDLTLHVSCPNTTGRDRWAWLPTYKDAQAQDLDYPAMTAATLVRGAGPENVRSPWQASRAAGRISCWREDRCMATTGFVVLTLVFQEEDGKWVGECEELGTATFADTFEQVREDLQELVLMHLNTLEEVGERERFFQEHGIRQYTDQTVPAAVSRQVPVARNERGALVTVYSAPLPALAVA